jgi:hypothetical protein
VAHLDAGPDRHRRLHDQHGALGRRRDRLNDGIDAGQVGVARDGRRRVDADEGEPRLGEDVLEVEREVQPAAVAPHEVLEPGSCSGISPPWSSSTLAGSMSRQITR